MQPHQEFLLIILLLQSLSALLLIFFFVCFCHFSAKLWRLERARKREPAHTKYYFYDFDRKSHIATRTHMVRASPFRAYMTKVYIYRRLLIHFIILSNASSSIGVTTRACIATHMDARGSWQSEVLYLVVVQSSQNSLTKWKLIFHFYYFRSGKIHLLESNMTMIYGAARNSIWCWS